jgi:hypothetical protein
MHLAIDPFNPFMFSTAQEDVGIKVWDVRKPSEAILTIPTDVTK